jgi:hypothetical protein
MVLSKRIECASGRLRPWFQIRVWHLALLVLIVALAICDIQDHARSEPVLVVLAAAGYAGYFLLVWLTWHYARRFEAALGVPILMAVFMTAMAAFFLVATIVYLVIEYAYLGGSRCAASAASATLPLQTNCASAAAFWKTSRAMLTACSELPRATSA